MTGPFGHLGRYPAGNLYVQPEKMEHPVLGFIAALVGHLNFGQHAF